MIPVGDDSDTRGPAVASLTLMALCVAGFLYQLSLGPGQRVVLYSLGFVPGLLFGGAELPAGVPVVPPPATLITYLFLHGGWLHLLGNLLCFWVFARKVEAAMGHGRFTVFFILCGIAAALAQAWPDTASAVPVIGASGGISGILGAYLVLSPRAEIRVLLPVFIVMRSVQLPAFVVLAAWFVFQLLYEYALPASPGGIAFRAHIGGFVTGLLLVLPFVPGHFRPGRRVTG